ncbi:hypothetical protein P9112_008742 [Eukaryota sp. TZLM1-RC]
MSHSACYPIQTPSRFHHTGTLSRPKWLLSYRVRDNVSVELDDVDLPCYTLPSPGISFLDGYSSAKLPSQPTQAKPSILEALQASQQNFHHYDVISFRNTISRLCMLNYLPDQYFCFFAIKRNSTLFLGMIDNSPPPKNEIHKKSIFIGRKVEQVLLGEDILENPIVRIMETTLSLNKGNSKEIKILLACETDCRSSKGEPIEIKSQQSSSKRSTYTRGEKAMKTWLQSTLGGVGKVLEIEHLNGTYVDAQLHNLDHYKAVNFGLPSTSSFNKVLSWDSRKLFGCGAFVLHKLLDHCAPDKLYHIHVSSKFELVIDEDFSEEGWEFVGYVDQYVSSVK